ncbi:MAG: LPP20 family lipoprotein [Rhodocyclaceae bacterium]
MRALTLALILSSTALLGGCLGCGPFGCAPETQSIPPQRVMATGHGAMGASSFQMASGQQRLMAMRAARVDAYRNLAEQVYGVRVWGNTTVSSFAAQSDSVRTYVDATLRGARLVNMTQLPDGSFEATMEIDLSPGFFHCVAHNTGCTAAAIPATASQVASCDGGGCAQPSAYYYAQ